MAFLPRTPLLIDWDHNLGEAIEDQILFPDIASEPDKSRFERMLDSYGFYQFAETRRRNENGTCNVSFHVECFSKS